PKRLRVERRGGSLCLNPSPKSVSLRPLLRHPLLEIRKRRISRRLSTARGPASPTPRLHLPLVLIVMAIQAQQLPIATVRRIVVVVVVAVMYGQLAQVLVGELAAAAPADPGVDLERLLAVAALALRGVAAGFGEDAVQLAGVACGHNPIL